MQQKELYICDFCNTQYEDKESATRCEQSHYVPKTIGKAMYSRVVCRQDGYPNTIEVVFGDGRVIKYKR